MGLEPTTNAAGRIAEYIFRVDGTFRGSVASAGTTLSRFTGEWTLRGATIHYRYRSDATGNIPPGTLDQDTLVEIAADHFIIQAADGGRRTYRRIAE